MAKLCYRLTVAGPQGIFIWEPHSAWHISLSAEEYLALESVSYETRQVWLEEIVDGVVLEGK